MDDTSMEVWIVYRSMARMALEKKEIKVSRRILNALKFVLTICPNSGESTEKCDCPICDTTARLTDC